MVTHLCAPAAVLEAAVLADEGLVTANRVPADLRRVAPVQRAPQDTLAGPVAGSIGEPRLAHDSSLEGGVRVEDKPQALERPAPLAGLGQERVDIHDGYYPGVIPLLVSLAYADDLWQLELSRAPVAEFAPHLSSEDAGERARAALALGRLTDEDALVPLATLVTDPEAEVRANAAFALGLTPGGDALIRAALEGEGDERVRERLVLGLGLHPDVLNLGLLQAALGASPGEARAAGVALGKYARAEVEGVDDDEIIAALTASMERLLDTEPRQTAAFAIARINPEDPPDLAALRHRARTDRDPVVRAFLVRGLTAASEADGYDLLGPASRDPDVGVRVAAGRGLSKLGMPEEPTRRLLSDPSEQVRMAAIEGLASEDAIDLLLPLLSEDNPRIVATVVRSLSAAGWEDHLRDALAHEDAGVRAAAVGGLTEVDQLVRLANRGEEARIRTAAASRLLELEERGAAPALLEASDPAVVGVGLMLLKDSPSAEDLDLALEAMSGATDLDILREGLGVVANAVPELRDPPPEAGLVVRRALASPSHSVRVAAGPAAEALGMDYVEPWPLKLPELEDVERIVSARILTDSGEIRVRFRTEVAPYTVWNFAKLADDDFFDGLAFHRVVPDFVIQDGCPRGDGWGGPAWSIPDELSWLPYDEGVLGMALSGPDTGGSQWFLTLSPQPHLDGAYTVFGDLDVGQGVMQSVHEGTVIEDVVIERLPR